MARKFLLLVATLLFIVNSANAEESNIDYEKISSTFFPETSTWYPLSKMKAADKDFILKMKPELQRAYSTSKIGKEMESENCSFIERAFSEEYSLPQGFYTFDVNSDGIQDIIYSGSTHCAEGDSTLIWFGTKDGFEIKQDVFWQMLTLRVKAGNPVDISSVSVACCSGIVDEYFVGNIINMRNYDNKNVSRNTKLPDSQNMIFGFTSTKEIVLRSKPEINDKYDEFESYENRHAVFGNILSKYLPGCTGKVISKNKTEKNQWCFVVIDKTCDPLRSYVGYDVNAGWARCESVNNRKK
jgi:hypothetical protein